MLIKITRDLKKINNSKPQLIFKKVLTLSQQPNRRTRTKRLKIAIIISKPRISEFAETCDPVFKFPRGSGREFGLGILIVAVDHAGLGIRTSES